MKTTFLPKVLVALTVMAAALTSCDKDVFDTSDHEAGVYKSALYVPIAEYLDTQADFSEYTKALRYSGTFNALNQSAKISFTAFVPNNEAMQDFYVSRGVSSLEELTPEYVRHFVKYHTHLDSIPTEQFVTLDKPIDNLDGEYMTVWIDPDNAGQGLLDNTARIIEMGLPASNGKIYVLSSVLTPLVETVTDRIDELGNSSIMMQALETSGWKKQLAIIADTLVEDGKKIPKPRYYTLLNVTDAVFAKEGITSLGDLTSRLQSLDTRGLSADSLLREYVAYHIMLNSYRLEDLAGEESTESTRIMGSQARGQIMSLKFDGTVAGNEERFTFNAEGTPASFVPGECDILCKNGYMHNLTSWLPVWEPLQTEVLWDFADYADIKSMVLADKSDVPYAPAEPVTKSQTVSLRDNPSAYTIEYGEGGTSSAYSAGVSYVTAATVVPLGTPDPSVFSKTANANDYVVFNVGYLGKVTIKTPVLVKGKYKIELGYYYCADHMNIRSQTSGSNGGLVCFQFDDRDDTKNFIRPYKNVPASIATVASPGFYTTTIIEEVAFDETSEHDFQMIVNDPAATSFSKFYLAFDYLRFVPID